MAQRMVDLFKRREAACQTDIENKEFIFYLSNYKFVRVYKSRSYKDYVLSFNFGKSKKYILNKHMWNVFKKYIKQIDGALADK